MTNQTLTERIAGDVDALLERNMPGQKVTRMELRDNKLVVNFGPVIEGQVVTTAPKADPPIINMGKR